MGLTIHTRVIDLDFIPRSQVCCNHKLQKTFFRLLLLVATHIKKIKHSKLRASGVYLRDIANTFSPVLHLNVSHPSICASCFFFYFHEYLCVGMFWSEYSQGNYTHCIGAMRKSSGTICCLWLCPLSAIMGSTTTCITTRS